MNKHLRYDESAECWLPCQLEQVAPALARLGAYLKMRNVADDVWKDIEQAVAEALNNAIIHGCKHCDEDSTEEGVTLHWQWSGDTLVITVHDPSDFMPESVTADLPENPLAERGRGHFLMASLMDEVSHLLIDGHHALELKKRLGPMAWSAHVLADTEAAIQALTAELGSCYENISAVFRFSEISATARNFTEFSKAVLQQLNALIGAQQSYIRLKTNDRGALRQIVSVGDTISGLPQELDQEDACLETDVFRSSTGHWLENADSLSAHDPLSNALGPILVCPIFFRSEVLGCLTVLRPMRGDPFLSSESALIRVVADSLANAYVAGRSHELRQSEEMVRRELEIASSIQQSLLPRTFTAQPPYRIFGLCRSAREVGGDFFDIISLESRGLLLVIADVMGKGMPAALLATIFRTAVQARQDLAATPGKLLTEVNRQLAPDLDNLDMFITAKVAFLSYEDHSLHYADAGHCPILVRRSDERVLRQIQADGFPLGVSDHFEYPTEVFQIAPGDALILITDGIYENLNAPGFPSSFAYLMRQILTLDTDDLSAFCNNVLGFTKEAADQELLLDDRTILVLKRDE